MNRKEKIIRVEALEKLIDQKEVKIAEEKNELKVLEQRLEKESVTEIPILLFLIDETLPMPDDCYDYEYEYVYYCPDLDKVKCVINHSKNEFFPNVVDMRKFFKEIGMPSKIWPGRAYNHSDKLNYAVSLLKTMIDDLFDSNNINSWNDLALLLNALPNYYIAPRYDVTEEKGQQKSIKVKKSQK